MKLAVGGDYQNLRTRADDQHVIQKGEERNKHV